MKGDPITAPTPEVASLERDIAHTRAALDRKVDEIERRLRPAEITETLKARVREKLDPEPYLGWIATSLVAIGGVMAVRGWRQRRAPQDGQG